MLSKIKIYFRHPNEAYHSIEGLFEQIAEGIPNAQKIYLPYPSNNLLNLIKNIWFVYKNQGQVNHITGDCHYIALGLRKKNKNILTIHDCVLLNRTPRWNPKFWIYKLFWYTIPVFRVNIVTVISQKTKDELLSFVNCQENKIQVISNFINPLFKPRIKPFKTTTPSILHIGTNPNKNIEGVINALKNIPCKFVIIGTLQKHQIELLQYNNISYENHFGLTIEQLIDNYRKADLVTFVSTYEGFGMPILEAQATGTPLITSNLTPMKELAGQKACLVDPQNIESIRQAIIKILNDEKYKNELVNFGFINIAKYTYQDILKRYESLYKN